MPDSPFAVNVDPDWEALLRCIRRDGTPKRVHSIELLMDVEVQEAICRRYTLLEDVAPDDPYRALKRLVATQQFLGYDYVRYGLEGLDMPVHREAIGDTAGLERSAGREYVNEHRGPITNWAEFERYPWPDPARGRRAASSG